MTEDDDRAAVESLYRKLLSAWNERNAAGFAALVATDGTVVGFDGSQLDGPGAVAEQLTAVFADHQPATYVSIVREVRFLTEGVALLLAVAGMVPPDGQKVMPERNAVQSLVAVRADGRWAVSLFQNTPATWDGRPDDVAKMTQELQALL
jgi:uncharacterized protein (TIGR02246 family)